MAGVDNQESALPRANKNFVNADAAVVPRSQFANNPKRTFEMQSINVRECHSLVQDHLTLKYKRAAKIIKVATINPAIKRIVRCSVLTLVNRSAIASSTPGKI